MEPCEHCDDECTKTEYCECEKLHGMPAHGKMGSVERDRILGRTVIHVGSDGVVAAMKKSRKL